jgi:hypothetical protein
LCRDRDVLHKDRGASPAKPTHRAIDAPSGGGCRQSEPATVRSAFDHSDRRNEQVGSPATKERVQRTNAMKIDEQIHVAGELLEAELPAVLRVAGLKPYSAGQVAEALLEDFALYTAPGLASACSPRQAEGTELAKQLGRKRTQLIEQMQTWLGPLERAAVILGMDHAAVTGEAEHTFCIFEETDSLFGEGAHAPGVFKRDGRTFQRLFGPTLTGPKHNNPLLMHPPADDQLDGAGFTRQILAMIEQLGDCSRRRGPSTTKRIQTSSPVPLTRARSRSDSGQGRLETILLPRLAVGHAREAGLRTTLTVEVGPVREMLADNLKGATDPASAHRDNGLRHAVIEIPQSPLPDGSKLEFIDDALLREYLGWMVAFLPLKLFEEGTDIEILLEHRDEHETLLHRRKKPDPADFDTEVTQHSSFVLLGYGLRPGDAQIKRNPRLPDPLLAIEVFEARSAARRCAQALGERYAPAYSRGISAEVRAFTRACRTIQRMAVNLAAAGYSAPD